MHYFLSRGVAALAIIFGVYAGFLASTLLLGTAKLEFSKPVAMSEQRVASALSGSDLFAFVEPCGISDFESVPAISAPNDLDMPQAPILRRINVSYRFDSFLHYPPNAVVGLPDDGGAPQVFVPFMTTHFYPMTGRKLAQTPYGTVYASQRKIVTSVAPPLSAADRSAAVLSAPVLITPDLSGDESSSLDTDNRPIIAWTALLALLSVLVSFKHRIEMRKTIGFICSAWAFGLLSGTCAVPPSLSLTLGAVLASIFLIGKEDKLLLEKKQLDAVNIAVATSTLAVGGAAAVSGNIAPASFVLAACWPLWMFHCARSRHLQFSNRTLRLLSFAVFGGLAALSIPLCYRVLSLLPALAGSSAAALELAAVPAIVFGCIAILRQGGNASLDPAPSVVARPTRIKEICSAAGALIDNHRQEVAFFAYCASCIGMISVLAFGHGAVGDLVAVRINDACRDANLEHGLQVANLISWAVRVTIFGALIVPLMPRIMRMGSTFATFAARLNQNGHILHHAAMALRSQTDEIIIRDRQPFIKAVGQTIVWYAFSYAVIFTTWMLVSLGYDSLYLTTRPWAQILFESSHASAIGAYAFAIMSVTYLPRISPCELVLSSDGFVVSKGFLAPLHFRPFRLWTDIKDLALTGTGTQRAIRIRFFSGGTLKLYLSQLAGNNLSRLLLGIDEHAPYCMCSPEINQLMSVLHCEKDRGNTHLPTEETTVSKLGSTTFSILDCGHVFEDRDIRVLKLLSSRSFCASYLVRAGDSLCVLKQIALPGKTADTVSKPARQLDAMLTPFREASPPGMAELIDTFVQNDQFFILQEHIRGVTVKAAVETGGNLRQRALRDVATELARLLYRLHTCPEPIVHGAINPDNLIFTTEGKLRINDFGAIDQFVDGVTGTVAGDVSYASPESIRGTPTVQSDIYSFGATLYFLATGRAPLALKQCDLHELDQTIPADLSELIFNCTAFNQSERPQSLLEVLHLLGSSTDELTTVYKASAGCQSTLVEGNTDGIEETQLPDLAGTHLTDNTAGESHKSDLSEGASPQLGNSPKPELTADQCEQTDDGESSKISIAEMESVKVDTSEQERRVL